MSKKGKTLPPIFPPATYRPPMYNHGPRGKHAVVMPCWGNAGSGTAEDFQKIADGVLGDALKVLQDDESQY